MTERDNQLHEHGGGVSAPDQSSRMSGDALRKDHLLTIALVTIFAVETVILVAILLALSVPEWIVAAIVAGKWLLPVIVLPVIVRFMWSPIARHFPAQPVGEGAVSRSFQSFAFGLVNRWNHCLTITVDASYLHIQPLELFRWFGARAMSIPFDAIENVQPSRLSGFLRGSAGPYRLTGPNWCMELAAPEPESGE